jgi:uncharacterized protein
MNCPSCTGELEQRKRNDVEVDVCNTCRGIWLDRGELDKIIANETQYYDRDDDDGDDDDGNGRGRGRQGKRGFFQNLMDSFGGDD